MQESSSDAVDEFVIAEDIVVRLPIRSAETGNAAVLGCFFEYEDTLGYTSRF